MDQAAADPLLPEACEAHRRVERALGTRSSEQFSALASLTTVSSVGFGSSVVNSRRTTSAFMPTRFALGFGQPLVLAGLIEGTHEPIDRVDLSPRRDILLRSRSFIRASK